MKSKKILLPEIKSSRRQDLRTKQSGSKSPKHMLKKLSSRQRSEAIGLIMIGLSAFFISLLRFLNDSKLITQFNILMVYLGLGIYILPVVIGLMGIQRFLDHSFDNVNSRIIGCLGLATFGLGLLGMEGGKIGIYSFDFFAGYFGRIPTKLLFLFMTLASLIFSLDILYKDLLKACVVTAGLCAKVLSYLWDQLLTLLSMLIEAWKTTVRFVIIICSHLREYLFPATADELEFAESGIGKLLTFTPGEATITDGIVPVKSDDDMNKIVTGENAPRISESNTNAIPPSGQIGTEVSFSILNINYGATSPTFEISPPPPFPPEASENYENLKVMVELDDDDGPREDINQQNNGNSDPGEVFLEDNLIDKEIKSNPEDKCARKIVHSASLLPSIELLNVPPPRSTDMQCDLAERSSLLIRTLEEFGIKASVTAIVEGPAVSRFELKPAPGVKVSRITSLIDDIALALAAQAIRIEAPIPGKQALGIEIPNPNPIPVYFYDLIKNDRFKSTNTILNLALGVTISGQPVYADLIDMPHLLIAGSTGSGKSVCVNTIIASILFQAHADQVKFLMIDPKMVELSSYNGIPHLISPVVTDPAQASGALLWAVEEMERRYEILAACGVRKISTYNKELERIRAEVDPDLEPMPFIVILIDELADLMMTASAEVEGSICRLAQMARAVGMHLVIATQRPSVNVLTGLIKANLPSRIAFSVASHIDSRTILDMKGAERLLGKGDMLFVPKGRNKPLRLQGAFISDRELSNITEWAKSQGEPEYMEIEPMNSGTSNENSSPEVDESDEDAVLMNEIEKYLETQEKTSTSMLQRKFRIGYNRAARIMDILEEQGIVSPLDGSNKRRVIGRRSGKQS